MSRLRVYEQGSPSSPRIDTADDATIRAHLGASGIRMERWRAETELPPDAGQDAILAAYRNDVSRLMRDHGYASADVVRMVPDHPQRAEFRAKFLNEHVHSEDEVRFFVEGSGTFYLHIGDEVNAVLCERGDLIGVPAGTTHWFDMGPAPRFAAIRLFTSPDGWVARFTGSDIAERFPKHGE